MVISDRNSNLAIFFSKSKFISYVIWLILLYDRYKSIKSAGVNNRLL